MNSASNRLAAAGLLAVVFLAGGAAGAAGYRAYVQRAAPRPIPPTHEERRSGSATVEADRIPFPLERLQLSEEEQQRLHEIARRWRPKAAIAVESIRSTVSDLENDMFAEMLCAISTEKQNRYLASLEENGGNRVLIDKRFRLVRSNQCGSVSEKKGRQ